MKLLGNFQATSKRIPIKALRCSEVFEKQRVEKDE